MKILVAILSVVLFAGVANAAPLDGDNEFSGAVSFGMVNDSHSGNLAGDLSFSRYFGVFGESPVLPQVGIRQGINYNFIDGARDQWLLDTSGFANLNLVDAEDAFAVPYIGTGLGVAYNDVGTSGILSPEGGVKLFVDDAGQTYVGLAYRYNWNFSNDDIGNGSHGAYLRVGYVWGGDRPTVADIAKYKPCCDKADAIEEKLDDVLLKQ